MVTVEKDLLVRLKNADQEAFRQVYELYIKKSLQIYLPVCSKYG